MLVLSAAAFAYTSKTMAFPVFAVILGLIGLAGRFGVSFTLAREIIVTLGLAAPFVASWRLSPYNPPLGVTPGFSYPLGYAFGLYFLTGQVLQFFLHRKGDLHGMSLVFAAMAMISAGNINATSQQELIYQILSLAFAVLAVIYVLSFRELPSRLPLRADLARRGAAVIVLAASLVTSVAVTNVLKRNERGIDNLFSKIFFGFQPPTSTGFSTLARLDSVNRMKHGPDADSITLRVFSKSAPPYLRGIAYARYGAGAWQSRGERTTLLPADTVPACAERPGPGRNLFELEKTARPALHAFDVWPDPSIEEGMFAPLGTVALDAPVTTLEVDVHGVTDSGELLGGMNYISYAPGRTELDELSAELKENLLQVPAGIDPRITAIAEELLRNCSTADEKIKAVLHFFHKNFEYRIGIKIPRDADPLTHFLVEKPSAHCEYFATGAAILLRIGGVPTRYVSGFVPAGRSAYGGYWVARNRDAHAWVEAYDKDRGWVIVEATPGSGVPSETSEGWLVSMLDYLKLLTLELQVMFRTEGALSILLRVLGRLGRLALFLVPVFAAIVVLMVRRKLRRRRQPAGTDPNVTVLHALLAVIDESLGRSGIERRPGETLHQFASRLSEGDVKLAAGESCAQWYRDYAGVRYSGDVTSADVERLTETLPG